MYENIKKIYTAGQMTGMKDFNFPAFFDLADQLEKAGFEVENPANNDGETLEVALANAVNCSKGSWEDYMAIDIPRVISCDAVVVLPGWRQSRGACWEVDIMRRLKRPVLRWDGGLKPLVEVIGVSGYATVGKDEAAKLLAPYGYERRAFADILRTSLYELNPIVNIPEVFEHDMDYLQNIIPIVGWQDAKIKSNDIRRLLQRMGTEVGRNLLGENIWVDAVFNTLEDGHKYVFTDMRFPNEYNAIKEYNGKTIRLSRPGVAAINNHPSETSLDNFEFDLYINNDSDLETLEKRLLDGIR